MKDEKKPYGYVLVLRALAGVAISNSSDAALRVMCVLAEYANQDGKCSVGQETIAARLGITRQAVHRTMTGLVEEGYVEAEKRPGRAWRYAINMYVYKDERAEEPSPGSKRWKRMRARDKARNARRMETETADADDNSGAIPLAASATAPTEAEKASLGPKNPDCLYHARFGWGEVIDPGEGDNKVLLRFDIGERRVLRPFLHWSPEDAARARVQHNGVAGGATLDVAGGATP